jgi:hypothetical protein
VAYFITFKTGALGHSATPPTKATYAGADESESGSECDAKGRFPLIVMPRTCLRPFQLRFNAVCCAEGRRTWTGQGREQPRGVGPSDRQERQSAALRPRGIEGGPWQAQHSRTVFSGTVSCALQRQGF